MVSDYTLILGDCLDKMSQIEDGSIDMICADLPYGTTACKWDVVIPFEPLWKHYKRVIKQNGAVVLFGSEPFSSLLRVSNLDWYKYDWNWKKERGTGFPLAKYQPLRIIEDILIFGDSATSYTADGEMMIFNPQMKELPNPYNHVLPRRKIDSLRTGIKTTETGETIYRTYTHSYPVNLLEFSRENGCKNSHPTQKPVALLAYLIRTYTNPGEMVLDNVFGSCSTGEACLREGRRFIGIEKDSTYYQIGVDRLARVAAELRGELNHLPMFAEVGA